MESRRGWFSRVLWRWSEMGFIVRGRPRSLSTSTPGPFFCQSPRDPCNFLSRKPRRGFNAPLSQPVVPSPPLLRSGLYTVLLPVYSHYFSYEPHRGSHPSYWFIENASKVQRTKGENGRREKNERVVTLVVHLHSNYTNIGQIARRVNRLDDRSLGWYARYMLSLLEPRTQLAFFCTRRPRFSDDPIFIYYAVRSRKHFTTRQQTAPR